MCKAAMTLAEAKKNVLTEIVAEMGPGALQELPYEMLQKISEVTGQSTGELIGGRKGTCPGCPFECTDVSEQAQNYGCLPSPGEIIQMKRDSGHNWSCHSDESKVCAGLCHEAKEHKLDLSHGNLISYETWYREGPEAAIEQANHQEH
jgi:hypothetical protein